MEKSRSGKKVKACKYCGMAGHSRAFCWAVPKKPLAPTALKKIGKHGQKWIKFRAGWFADFPPEWDGKYICYLCGDRLTPKETTLDHVLPRSSYPELRYDYSNIRTCCWRCNGAKGSKH